MALRMAASGVSQVNVTDMAIAALRECLFAWFKANRRDFPWRDTCDPYAILVAEKLLQQTTAREAVTTAFQTILNHYPDPRSLAKARLRDLRVIIAPLGFLFRARHLKDMATALVKQHQGQVPAELGELKTLPGVGDYAARAVLSFAYGKDEPIVDANIGRFLHRVFELPFAPSANPARDKRLIDLAAKLIPPGNSRSFNFAMLDLCALVCTSRKPKCPICPLRTLCCFGRAVLQARSEGK